MQSSNNSSFFSLAIDPLTKTHLAETARWARFLAIFGMIVLALGLLVALMGATVFTRFFGFRTGIDDDSNTTLGAIRIGMVVGTLILSAVIFFPLLFLLRFANNIKRALAANDQLRLNQSFQNLKVYFRYLGILVLVFFVIYGVVIALAIHGLSGAR